MAVEVDRAAGFDTAAELAQEDLAVDRQTCEAPSCQLLLLASLHVALNGRIRLEAVRAEVLVVALEELLELEED